MLKDPNARWGADELLEHPFITNKATVHLREAELLQLCEALRNHFTAHPEREYTLNSTAH